MYKTNIPTAGGRWWISICFSRTSKDNLHTRERERDDLVIANDFIFNLRAERGDFPDDCGLIYLKNKIPPPPPQLEKNRLLEGRWCNTHINSISAEQGLCQTKGRCLCFSLKKKGGILNLLSSRNEQEAKKKNKRSRTKENRDKNTKS